jgi:hypothetical protein
VDCINMRFMLSSMEVCRVVRKLKMEGDTDTNADDIFYFVWRILP